MTLQARVWSCTYEMLNWTLSNRLKLTADKTVLVWCTILTNFPIIPAREPDMRTCGSSRAEQDCHFYDVTMRMSMNLVDVFARLQPIASSFCHRCSCPSGNAHLRLQAIDNL